MTNEKLRKPLEDMVNDLNKLDYSFDYDCEETLYGYDIFIKNSSKKTIVAFYSSGFYRIFTDFCYLSGIAQGIIIKHLAKIF